MGKAKTKLSNINTERNRVVRQTRIDLAGEDCKIFFEEKEFELLDCSPFGVAFKAKKNFNFSSLKTNQCKIFYQNILIGEVTLKYTRTEALNNFDKVGCAVLGKPLEIEKILGVRAGHRAISLQNQYINKLKILPDSFRQIVCEMKVWLQSLKEKVDAIEEKNIFNTMAEEIEFENTMANAIGAYISETFEPIYVDLESSIRGLEQSVQEDAFSFFREQMVDLLVEAPFHRRAFTKPLGYAGDYQMMNQIYSYEGIGDSLFSKCLHLYFITAPESRAVRNRAQYLQTQIAKAVSKKKGNKIRILSVACGPAMEIQEYLSKNTVKSADIKFSLLDQDLEALQFAQRKLRVLERDLDIEVDFELHHMPIKKVIARGLSDTYDLIYSAGLFDYFTDPVATMAAQRLWEALNPKGKLIIGNFSDASLGKLTMDIALDWHLIYRSEAELTKLFSSIGSSFKIESEEEGINLFCHIEK